MEEDDLSLKGRIPAVQARDGRHDDNVDLFHDDHSRALFRSRYNVDRPPRSSDGNVSNDSGTDDLVLPQTIASIDIPLQLTSNGLMRSIPVATTCMMKCTIPPCGEDGRWAATVKGNTVVRGPMGATTGSFLLKYLLFPGRTMVLGHVSVGDDANVLLGASHKVGQKSLITLGCSLHDDAGRPPTINAEVHRNIDDHFDAAICVSTTTEGSGASIRTEIRGKDSGTRQVRAAFSWKLFESFPSTLLEIISRVSEKRKCKVTVRMLHDTWDVALVLSQALSPTMPSVVDMGVCWGKTSVHWILSWSRGNGIVRIPIVLPNPYGGRYKPFQVALLSMASWILQHAMERLFVPPNGRRQSDVQKTEWRKEIARLRLQKLRGVAEQQKRLMEERARKNTNTETEKNGLVIERAIYKVSGGTPLDVTTQLQFLVKDSSLQLPSGSKKDLLGFFDVAVELPPPNVKRGVYSSWAKFFRKERPQKPIPTLIVRYMFTGERYELAINDKDALSLPSTKAKKVQGVDN